MSPFPSPSRIVLSLALIAASGCAKDRAPATVRKAHAARPPVRTNTIPVVQAANVTPAEPPLVAPPQQGDTGTPHRVTPKLPTLTDAEQRIADGVVFAPRVTERFLVASRKKRLLVDVGRVDLARLDAEQLATLRKVSARIGPLSNVTHLHVRGSWGEETDSIVGYDVWNGRAVAVLAASPGTDSLLKTNASLVGVATRAMGTDSTAVQAPPVKPPVAATVKQAGTATSAAAPPICVRDSLVPLMQVRATAVRDSLLRWVTDSLRSPFIRFAKATTVRGEAALGCFGNWRAIVVVNSRTPGFEWNEERTLLVAADGKVQTARLRDLRLRAHESLLAFDADGDGVDELSARGLATRMGAQSIMKLDPATRRFARFASGFAWETR